MALKASLGILALILAILAVFYLGNQVVQTTPFSGAAQMYQYKVVSVSVEDKIKLTAFAMSSGVGIFGANDPKVMEDLRKGQSEGITILEKTLNDAAQGGWEYVGVLGSDYTSFIFRK